MAILKRNIDPAIKEKREADFQLWVKKKRNEKLFSVFSAYSKCSILIFFALILLARWVSLENFYFVFPIFWGIHLFVIFLFPAYFSFFPAYGKTKDEKEGFSVCTFLLGPSIFSLFYFYRYSSVFLWLCAIGISILGFALLLLRYRKEVLARISCTVILEFFLLLLSIGGVLLMTGFLTASSNPISSEAVTVVEKSEQNQSYILTLSFENGEQKPYYVAELLYREAEQDETLYFEICEGLFFVQTVQIVTEPSVSP